MSKSFHFVDGEIGAKIIAEGGGEAEEVGERKAFFENFVFDADKDFLLGGATTKVTASGAVTGASEAEGLTTIDGVGSASFEYGAGVVIVFDIFVKSDIDAT